MMPDPMGHILVTIYIYIHISRISSRIRTQPIYSLLHEGAVGNSRTSEKKFIYVPVVPDMWLRKAFQIWVLNNHTTIHKIKQSIHMTSKNLPIVQRATVTSSLQSLLLSINLLGTRAISCFVSPACSWVTLFN